MKFRETDMDITRDYFQCVKAAIDKAKDTEESIKFIDKVKRITNQVLIERPTEQLKHVTFTSKGVQINDRRAMFSQRIINNAKAASTVRNNQNINQPKQSEADHER